MSFTIQEYQDAANTLNAEIASVQAVSDVESSGVTMWTVDGKQRPPVRLEAAWFGKFTNYKYNESDPDISSTDWNPALAATTQSGAWAQVLKASNLDKVAAIQATSWGAFQIMGMHYADLGYKIPEDFVNAAFTEAGQMQMFVKFIESERNIWNALKAKNWTAFATGYNGTGQVATYAANIESAYERYTSSPGLRVLHQGMSGQDVMELQQKLNIPADGQFGPATFAAVEAFQKAHGLYVDGVVGPETADALKG